MKRSKLIAIMAFLTFNVSAAEKITDELALEYLNLSRFEQSLTESNKATIMQFSNQLPPEELELLSAEIAHASNWNEMKFKIASIVKELYTRQEIESAISYMKTPDGMSMTIKNDEFSKRFAAIYGESVANTLSAQ